MTAVRLTMLRIPKNRASNEEVKEDMKTAKTKTAPAVVSQPVWCHHCCIRIAPYDLRTVSHGKDYHRDCFAKVAHAKAAKN